MNQTKSRILEAARAVLIREGSAEFSVRKVAEEAAVRLYNVQYYFPTKVDLIDGLLVKYLEANRNGLLSGLDGAGKGKEGLRDFLANTLQEEAVDDEIRLSVAITALIERPDFGNRMSVFYDDFYEALLTHLKTAAGKDSIDSKIQEGASLLLPFINGYGLVSSNLGLGPKQTADVLTELVWDLITRAD